MWLKQTPYKGDTVTIREEIYGRVLSCARCGVTGPPGSGMPASRHLLPGDAMALGPYGRDQQESATRVAILLGLAAIGLILLGMVVGMMMLR